MNLKHRLGQFFAFVGAIGIFVFFASVLARTGNYEIAALLWGVGLFSLGLSMQTRPAPASHAPRFGLLNFGKRPAKPPAKPKAPPAAKPKAPAPTPSPAAAAPAQPAKPKGLAALFGRRPQKK